MRRLSFVVCSLVVVLAGCAHKPVPPKGLTPERHADFHHDTLALTWQPGFCSVESGCGADQPHGDLIGLHGLWASEPHTLEAKGVRVQEWWRKGCDLLEAPSDEMPGLPPDVSAGLAEMVPHVTHPLVPHEFKKHARCFGYKPDLYFQTALNLRKRFDESFFAQWMRHRAGSVVSHAALLTAFDRTTGNTMPRALQLRCSFDAKRRVVLTQLWLTLSPKQLDTFPAAGSYLPAPEAQDNCPAQFLLPNW